MANELNLTAQQMADATKAMEKPYLQGKDIPAMVRAAAPFLQPDLRQHDEELLDKFIAKLEFALPSAFHTKNDMRKVYAEARATLFSKKPRYEVAVCLDSATLTCDGVMTGCFFPDEYTAQEYCDFLNSKEDSKCQ
jgi:hypothetical protein